MKTILEVKRKGEKLSAYERKNPLITINTHVYSIDELPVTMKLVKKPSEEELRKIAVARLKRMLTEIPTTIYTLTLDKPTMTSEEMLRDVEEETELGKTMVETEVRRMHRILKIVEVEK